MTITLRRNIGRPLTWAELDGNFSELNDGLQQVGQQIGTINQAVIDAEAAAVTAEEARDQAVAAAAIYDDMNAAFVQMGIAVDDIAAQVIANKNGLALPTGATEVGVAEGGTVQDALDGRVKQDELSTPATVPAYAFSAAEAQSIFDNALPMQNYTALRAYTGRAAGVRITTPGIAGTFQRDAADTTSADNGGTIIVDASARRWKRIFDQVVRLSWFQAKGDWNGTTGTNDTAAIQAAVNACKNLSVTEVPADTKVLTGLPLHIENTQLSYLCTAPITIDRPITIVGEGQGRALNSQTTPRIFFQNCSGFSFTQNAYLFDIRNLRIDGMKVGGINPEASDPALRTFGNAALVFQDGLSRGRFENCQFTGFDIGKLGVSPTPLANPPGWAGAYKHFNYCGFLNCTYSVCNLDHVTDETYVQTYFRCDSTVDGYFLVQAPIGTVAYCTINLIGCSAEGICKKVDPTTPYLDFASRGFRFKGRTDVVISGGYYELNTWLVDAGATLTSNAWLAPRFSDLFGGGGLIDLSGSFANTKQIAFPDFSNAYWLKTNLTRTGFALVGDNYAEQFTVGAGGTTSMQSNDLTVDRLALMPALPNAYRELFLLCEVEWHSNAGTTLSLTCGARNADGTFSSPAPATYASPTYYSASAGWKRIFYTLPLPSLIGGKKIISLSPAITITGAANADVISIRQCRFSVLAR
jgi:hypothetical protein